MRHPANSVPVDRSDTLTFCPVPPGIPSGITPSEHGRATVGRMHGGAGCGQKPARLGALAVLVGVALLLAGCGQAASPRAAPVKLTLNGPADNSRVETGTATISGVVAPHGASVLVLGRRVAPETDGSFSATVALSPGTNLVDVIASAPHARPAMLSLRVIRYVLITVPDVTGKSPNAAANAIRAQGLGARVHGDGDPLAFLLPVPEQVCSQSPAGGHQVEPGTTVTLYLGKLCT